MNKESRWNRALRRERTDSVLVTALREKGRHRGGSTTATHMFLHTQSKKKKKFIVELAAFTRRNTKTWSNEMKQMRTRVDTYLMKDWTGLVTDRKASDYFYKRNLIELCT